MAERGRLLPANVGDAAASGGGLGRAAENYVRSVHVRSRILSIAFLLVVILPTSFAIVFYGFLASPRYVSDVKFVVRSMSSQRITGLDLLFQTIGLGRAADDAYVVVQFLQSKDIIPALEKQGIDLRQIFQREEADRLSRYPRIWRPDSTESLFDFYMSHVTILEDSAKGIINVSVITFRPEDSQALANGLIRAAEEMVNRMNERAQNDAIHRSEQDVKDSEQDVMDAQRALTDFRNRETLVDPTQSTVSLMETITSISQDLSYAMAQLSEVRKASPHSPMIPTLEGKIAALETRIREEKSKMVGNDNSLAAKIATYEQLTMQRDLADKSLVSALTSLDSARQDARRQRIYVEEIAAPNLADESTEPQRIRAILTYLVFGLTIFAVIWILSVGAGEHAQ